MKINQRMKLTEHELDLISDFYLKNKKRHNILFEMYKDLAEAFDKANIEFVVFGGTNLGAVLYQDFIPWDDDFDLAINYKDKDKLFNELPKYLPKKYKLVNAIKDKGYQYAFPKILNKEMPFSKKEFGENKKYSYVFVDVTMYKETSRENKTWRSRFFGKWLWLRGAQINWFVDLLMSIFKILPQKFLINQVYKSFDNDKTGSMMMELNPYSRKENNIHFEINKRTLVPFRDIKVPIVKNWEELFSQHYNRSIDDLYTLPKVKVTHGLEI